ncbi:hypothetical protein DYGSA30_45260 [Dyella sp. GSA-30]|nr:hypothetical protein DYGSA30_45260 [Dyella sp. GSA-30]
MRCLATLSKNKRCCSGFVQVVILPPKLKRSNWERYITTSKWVGWRLMPITQLRVAANLLQDGRERANILSCCRSMRHHSI